MLTAAGCQERLANLRAVMAQATVDTALITASNHVYYFSGHLTPALTRSALVVAEHTAVLATGVFSPGDAEVDRLAVSEVRTFLGNAHGSTIRPDQDERLARLLADVQIVGRVGSDLASCPALLRDLCDTQPTDLTAAIRGLRRTKHADELELMQTAAKCIDACYAYARQRIEPGLNELTLYGDLLRVAVETAGEQIGRFGQDFQCASPGGPARDRVARAGELWILDLGVEYRGYHADASRAFAVAGKPTAAQQDAWHVVVDTLQAAAAALAPGGSCLRLFRNAQATLDQAYPDAFFHHLGHGMGLQPHEAPFLNPEFDDHLAVGDVVTVEPGVYTSELQAGIRLENDFVITATGADQITHAELRLDR
jgi:Xaa-Pro dipeptidase